jgi:hypothetical protein
VTPASDTELIRWWLKHLNAHASDLSASDLDWTIKMEEAFRLYGRLSEKQMKTLEEIYKRS